MSLFGNSVLAGSAGQGPSADLGDTIEQSLRFTGSQLLESSYFGSSNTFGSNWSISFWVKFAGPIDTTRQILATGTRTAGGNYTILALNDAVQGQLSTYSGATSFYFNNRKFRDPSAWYHILMTNSEFYINGEAQSATSGYWSNFDGCDKFGFSNWTGTPNSKATMYLAEFHLLQTTLTPTDFGKTNEDGVWVPISTSFTAAQYGANGAHLTFDSSQTNAGIAEDSAPIGASGHTARNDYTASGFDTGDVALYSAQTTATNGGFDASFPVTNMFDGLLTTMAAAANSNGVITFEPSTAIAFTNGVYMNVNHTAGSPGEFRTTIDGTTSAWTTFPNPANSSTALVNQLATGSGSLEKIEVRRTDANRPAIVAVGINGTATSNILVDNTDNDVDFNDTPTSNYATGNPIDAIVTIAPSFTYDSANLAGIGSQNGAFFGLAGFTISLDDTNNYYWEIETTSSNDAAYPNLVLYQTWGSAWTDELFIWYRNGTRYFDGTSVSSALPTWNVGDICGMRFDGSNDTVYCSVNGGTETSFTLPSRIRDIRPGYLCPPQNSARVKLNFGQMPFIYQPANSVAMQTNNLAEPTIKNGKEHFDVLTWTGDGASPKTRTGLEFTPDLIWIKERNQNFSIGHRLYDSVRGAGVNKHLDSSTGQSEGYGNDAEYGYVTGFVDGGFTTQAGSLGDDYVNDTSTNYVAWCWKAGGTAVSNTDGTITSSVSANTDAGFSIVSYTGTGSAATVGHGLNEAPEFVIATNRTDGGGWSVWHTGIAATQALNLNNTNGAFTATHFNSTAPSSSVVSLGSHNNTNESGKNHIMYCWHSVEGFSKFGKYIGTGTTDNAFVYTGFRPALVWFKSIAAGAGWFMYDTTRSVNNATRHFISSDSALGETTGFDIDILSNGFKIRASNGPNAASTGAIYMAFAESPFGGENQPPATAR